MRSAICGVPASRRDIAIDKNVLEELESLLRTANLTTNLTTSPITEPNLDPQPEPLLGSDGPFIIDILPPVQHLSFPLPDSSGMFDMNTVPSLQPLAFPLPSAPGAFDVNTTPALPQFGIPPPALSETATVAEHPDNNGLIALGLYEQFPSFATIDEL